MKVFEEDGCRLMDDADAVCLHLCVQCGKTAGRDIHIHVHDTASIMGQRGAGQTGHTWENRHIYERRCPPPRTAGSSRDGLNCCLLNISVTYHWYIRVCDAWTLYYHVASLMWYHWYQGRGGLHTEISGQNEVIYVYIFFATGNIPHPRYHNNMGYDMMIWWYWRRIGECCIGKDIYIYITWFWQHLSNMPTHYCYCHCYIHIHMYGCIYIYIHICSTSRCWVLSI